MVCTLTRHTFLVLVWTPSCLQKCLNSLWHIDLTRCWKHSLGILKNIDIRLLCSCCSFVSCTSMMQISTSTTSQMCSIGLRFGDCGLVNSTSFKMIWALCHGTLHQQQPEPLIQGRIDPCFHVVYSKFWPYHSHFAAETEVNQTKPPFSNLLLSYFGELDWIVATGVAQVIFCFCSPSAWRFDVLTMSTCLNALSWCLSCELCS